MLNSALIVRIAVVLSILAMLLVIVGIAWGGTYLFGAVLMAVSMAGFAAAGVFSAVRGS